MSKSEPESSSSVFETRLSAQLSELDAFRTDVIDMTEIMGGPPIQDPPAKPKVVMAFATELDGAGQASLRREPRPRIIEHPEPRGRSPARSPSIPVRLRIGFLAGLTLGALVLMIFSRAPASERKMQRALAAAASGWPPSASPSVVSSVSPHATVEPSRVPAAGVGATTEGDTTELLKVAVAHYGAGRLRAAAEAYRALAKAKPEERALMAAAEILERKLACSGASLSRGDATCRARPPEGLP